MFDLVRRRQAVLKLAQRAGQVYEQSTGLQRDAQQREPDTNGSNIEHQSTPIHLEINQ